MKKHFNYKLNLEMERILTDEVRKRDNLWSINREFFNMRNIRKHSYEEIVKVMSLHCSKNASVLTQTKKNTSI